MNTPIVSEGDGKLRPPSTVREAIALVLAAVLGFLFVQLVAPWVRSMTFLDETLRDNIGSLGISAVVPLYGVLKDALNRAGGDPEFISPTLAPWFVTGLIAAVLLFVWNQFTAFIGGYAAAQTLQVAGGASGVSPGQALTQGALFVSLPLSAIAAFVAGVVLNRNTRSFVGLALVLAALGYLALHLLMLWTFERSAFLQLWTDGGEVLLAAFGVLALMVFAFGGLGAIISGAMGDRSIGRLVHAARRLKADEREAVTEGVLRRIESRL